jgi:hypothetical protein
MMRTFQVQVVLASGLWLVVGCGKHPAPAPTAATPATAVPVATTPTPPAVVPATPAPAPLPEAPLPTISLGGPSTPTAGTEAGSQATSAATTANTLEQRRLVVAALDGVQVILGSWKGTTNKAVGDFKALDAPNWVWDFRTVRGQPALVMKSEKNLYVTEARLTYLPDRQIYQMVAQDKEGQTRTLEGQFTSPVEEFEGDDRRVHRKFKLQLTEVGDAKDALKLTLNQQDNNRYLLEVERKKGGRFARVDTIGTQREGSSFALNDTDYKDKTCVISGGLGTSQVSYNGKSYWVCCSGCQAAFNEEPARWVAEFEAKQKEKEMAKPAL